MDLFRGRNLKSVFSNTSSQFIIRLTTSSSTLITTLIIAYFLGIDFFGSFIKITVFISFFYLLIDFGMNPIFLKDFENPEAKLFNFIILRQLMSLVLFILIVLTTFVLPYDQFTGSGFSSTEKIGIIIFSLTLFTQGLIFSSNSIFQKKLSYRLSVVPNVSYALVILTLVLIGGVSRNLNLILLSYFLAGLVFFIISIQIFRTKYEIKFHLNNFTSFSKIILTSSLPLALILLFNLVYFRADTFILSFLKPNQDVGTYGFSYKFFEFLIAVPAFFSNSIYPLLLAKERNSEDINSDVKVYSLILLLLSFIFLALVFLFSPFIAYFKQGFEASILPLKILSLSLPFFFLTSILQWMFIIKNKKMILLIIYFASMLINILLNIIFIPKFSYIASAYITVFSEGLIFLFMISFILLRPAKGEGFGGISAPLKKVEKIPWT